MQAHLPGIITHPPGTPAVLDSSGRLSQSGSGRFGLTGSGKSLALWAHCECVINTIQDEGFRARVLMYCALDRLEGACEGAVLLDGEVQPDVWDDDPLYVVVRPGLDPETGKPRVNLRQLMSMARPDGIPTFVFIDEVGEAMKTGQDGILSAADRNALASIAVAGRGGHRVLGVGPTVWHVAAQQPAQVHPSVRNVAIHHKVFGPYGEDDGGAGIPSHRVLPPVGSPVGTFYDTASKRVVRLPTTYDRTLIIASHGADWGARK